MNGLTRQEKIFLERAAAKMTAGVTPEQAMRAVLADDVRIVNAFFKLSDEKRTFVARAMSDAVHARVNGAA